MVVGFNLFSQTQAQRDHFVGVYPRHPARGRGLVLVRKFDSPPVSRSLAAATAQIRHLYLGPPARVEWKRGSARRCRL